MDQVASPEHQQLALEAAEKSIVLLKNDNHLLPLVRDPERESPSLGLLRTIRTSCSATITERRAT
jgi:beta-glucosidase-like glycosyl hydrolase